MALLSRKSSTYHVRPSNKEPEWSSICNNVFDQYLDSDDLFAVNGGGRERSSSDDSGNLFDFSGSSEQSNQTNATSPIPAWHDIPTTQRPQTETKHPKAKSPGDFWTKKLRALEQNAAECEARQQKLRTAKSHPDFLSLGGHPSPGLPPSPTDQSCSARRSRSRVLAANGRKTPTQRSVTSSRYVSRGRPVGVTKPPPGAAIHPSATIRKTNASPSKMMTPSRYRAGFKDIWSERIEHSPRKYELRVPSSAYAFPDSPPPSARSTQNAFAAFGSPIAPILPLHGCDDQISPLANTFQSARLHTPLASPLVSPGSHAVSSYFESAAPLPGNPYTTQSLPLNDTAPLFPERISSLATNRTQSFDFGFSRSPVEDAWDAARFAEPSSTVPFGADLYDNQDPFGGLDTLTAKDVDGLGLGISCDPTDLSNDNYITMPTTSLLPNTGYQPPSVSSVSPFYAPNISYGLANSTNPPSTTMPNTPRRRGSSRSPSPTATSSRSRQTSGARRASRHRRTKSSSSAPRVPPGADKGGFVNFTPSDSNKILSGVAPSGSSKTKARREKEAADKTRKLSQAAMRAVIDAGGDVEALQKAGLIA